MKQTKKAKKTVKSASMFSVSASDVFEKIDERFNRQEEKNQRTHDEMQRAIRELGEKIDAQIHTFDKQLSKLNDNMSSVLEQIKDHEHRLTALETTSHDKQVEKKTWSNIWQSSVPVLKSIGWFLVILGAANGVKPLMKIFNLFAQ